MDLTSLQSKVVESLKEIDYELVSLTIKNENKEMVVSLIVDRIEPIDMDAIVEVSNKINALFDELNPFDCSYNLDVSSLGAEKPLKVEDLSKYVNRYVNVHTINPIEGENILEGDISGVTDEKITLTYRIKTRIKTVDIQKSNISKIRLAIKF